MRDCNVINTPLEEEFPKSTVDCIYKEVVIIGNGPSAITLSYLLSGHRPYYNRIPHPDPMLSARLIECTQKSLMHQDLAFLAQGLEGRSKNPISLLIDAMTHPGADMGLEWPSLLSWKKTAKSIDHIVIGKEDPGGTWHRIASHILTISPGRWMALPGLEFVDYHDKRAPTSAVAKYYMDYVRKNDLTSYMLSHSTVTLIKPLIGKSRRRARWKVWVTDANNSIIRYECRHLVLATGASDKAGCLGVPGEVLPFVSHDLKSFEEHLSRKDETASVRSKNVLLHLNESVEIRSLPYRPEEKTNVYISESLKTSDSPESNTAVKGHRDRRLDKNSGILRIFEVQSLNDIQKDDCSNEFNKISRLKSPENDSWIAPDIISEKQFDLSLNELELNGGGEVDGANSFVTLRKNEKGEREEEKESRRKVLVVGAGLSAADAILVAWSKNYSVIHAFRSPLTTAYLPASMYPEYHELYKLMQGSSFRKDYLPLPGHQVTEIRKDNSVEVIDSSNNKKILKVFSAAILIGSQPDLLFLPKTLKNLGVDSNKPVDCKVNPVLIDPYTYKCIRAPPGLYALGPLVGDNFVRFLQGGAIAIAGHILKDSSLLKVLTEASIFWIFPVKMPPVSQKDAIVIALDVGKSVSTLHYTEEKTFFELARDCVSWIIQRKIISQSMDVISLLLIGSEESDNQIAANGYKNICGKFDFQLASWDMLKFIETEVKTTNNSSDWLGALIVSVEILKLYEEFNDIQNKKIVFFSDFAHPVSDDINVIIQSMEKQNIEVTIIGPDHLYFLTESDDENEPRAKRKKFKKTKERQKGERVVYDLWRKLPESIVICTFESALKQLCSYAPKTKRINYWNCILDIGDMKINVSVAKKTDPKTAKKFDTKCLKLVEKESSESISAQGSSMAKSTETVPTVRDKVMHYRRETGDGSEFLEIEVQPEDTVEGFRYGTTVIPFSGEDKAALEYKSGPKCFSIIGFASISSVPYYLLSGECSYVVVPRVNDKNAEVALSALIQGMKKTECLAIIRRVYSDNCGLSLGILHPIIEEIICDETGDVSYSEYLLFVELAFEDDVKYIDFPSLERFSKEISEKQYEVVDNLIDGMNLMKADKGLRGEFCEAFDLPFLHDFKEQFFHYSVIQKGLYPDKPLPTSLPPYIKNFTKAPKSIEEKCKSLIKDIKAEFKIELVKEKFEKSISNDKLMSVTNSRGQTDADKEKQSEISDSNKHFSEEVIEGEKNRLLRHWMRLFGKDFPTDEDLDQFISKIAQDRNFDRYDVTKYFLQVITEIRKKYFKVVPEEFNTWVSRFKEYTREKSGIVGELWEIIVTENIGLISVKENHYSNITEEEAEEFLCDDKRHSSVFTQENSGISAPDVNLPTGFLQELEKEQMNIDSLF